MTSTQVRAGMEKLGPRTNPDALRGIAAGKVARRELVAVAFGCAAFALALIMHSAWRGSLGTARSDDWSYLRTAFDLDRTGSFRLNGWASSTLVGQVLLTRPVVMLTGSSIAALQVTVATLGAAALWIWYLVLRRSAPVALACLGLAAVAGGPLFGSLAVSYMTDVPALFAVVLTLYAGTRIVNGDRTWWLAAAAAGILAFSIREYAAVAFLAVVAARWQQGDRRPALAGSFAVVCVGLFAWRHSLPFDNQLPVEPQPAGEVISRIARLLVSTGFLLAPITVAIRLRSISRRSLLAGGVAAVSCLLFAQSEPFVGNYLARSPVNATALRLEQPWWALIVAVSVWSLAVLLASVFRRRPTEPADRLIATYAAGYGAVLAIVAAFTPMLFDRYLLLWVPALAWIVVAGRQPRSVRPAALMVSAFMLVIGFAYVDATAALDGAHWDLGEEAVAAGVPADRVDAGWEWYSFHQHGPAIDPLAKRHGPHRWVRWFDGSPCVTVDLEGGQRHRTVRSPLMGTETLFSRELPC